MPPFAALCQILLPFAAFFRLSPPFPAFRPPLPPIAGLRRLSLLFATFLCFLPPFAVFCRISPIFAAFYYLHKKYITKNENSLFIDIKRTNYCSIMDQYLVWYPLASMMAAILRGMDL